MTNMNPREYGDDLFTITIRSADTINIENELVRAISAKNSNGPFDILPLHADCISVIEEELVLYPKETEKRNILIHKGVLRVEKGNVYIFLDTLTK